MAVHVDVWLRGQDFATTRSLEGVRHEPRDWTVEDVREVLQGMLIAMHRLKHPDEAERSVALRGLSWIVSPYEEGGVVIAIEITMGAAVAGPFDIDGSTLEALISSALASAAPDTPPPSSERVH